MKEDRRARRYLLNLLSEDERDAIEHAYFRQPAELDRLGDIEDELIEDYLEDRLSAEEREPFERDYLASPVHRTRVDTIRQLKQRSESVSRRRHAPAPWRQPRWLAVAAAALLALAVGLWMFGPPSHQPPDTAERAATAPPAVRPSTPRPPAPAEPAASVFAIELSPLALRGPGQAPPMAIPAGTDLVDLRFEREPGLAPPAQGRVVITTVEGEETWRGALAVDAGILHAQVPAPVLAPNDYLVNVDGLGRYVLRVR